MFVRSFCLFLAQMWQYDEITEKLTNKSDDWMFGGKKWNITATPDGNFVQIKTCNEQVTTVLSLRKKYWFGFDVSWLDHIRLGWGTENEAVLEESGNSDNQMWNQVKCENDGRYFKLENKKFPKKFLTATGKDKVLTVEGMYNRMLLSLCF